MGDSPFRNKDYSSDSGVVHSLSYEPFVGSFGLT